MAVKICGTQEGRTRGEQAAAEEGDSRAQQGIGWATISRMGWWAGSAAMSPGGRPVLAGCSAMPDPTNAFKIQAALCLLCHGTAACGTGWLALRGQRTGPRGRGHSTVCPTDAQRVNPEPNSPRNLWSHHGAPAVFSGRAGVATHAHHGCHGGHSAFVVWRGTNGYSACSPARAVPTLPHILEGRCSQECLYALQRQTQWQCAWCTGPNADTSHFLVDKVFLINKCGLGLVALCLQASSVTLQPSSFTLQLPSVSL